MTAKQHREEAAEILQEIRVAEASGAHHSAIRPMLERYRDAVGCAIAIEEAEQADQETAA